MHEDLYAAMTTADWSDLRQGAAWFNAGRFWHAHEAWEAVWRRQRSHPAHVFFKGLIQLAAAHHQREHGRFRGMLTHLARVRTKLTPFAPAFLSVDVDAVIAFADAAEREGRRLGPGRLGEFDRALIPVIRIPTAYPVD